MICLIVGCMAYLCDKLCSPKPFSERKPSKTKQRPKECCISRLWRIATIICSRPDLRSNNCRIIAILHSLSKHVHYLVFVAIIGIGLNHNLRYYLPDGTRIYNESIVCLTSNTLKHTISEEYYNRINWDTGILRQTLFDSTDMSGVLHHRIIKAMLLSAISQ